MWFYNFTFGNLRKIVRQIVITWPTMVFLVYLKFSEYVLIIYCVLGVYKGEQNK